MGSNLASESTNHTLVSLGVHHGGGVEPEGPNAVSRCPPWPSARRRRCGGGEAELSASTAGAGGSAQPSRSPYSSSSSAAQDQEAPRSEQRHRAFGSPYAW